MGLIQGLPLSPVLYDVYTKGLADLRQNGPSKVFTLADGRLKTSRDTQEAAEIVQQKLDNLSYLFSHHSRNGTNIVMHS